MWVDLDCRRGSQSRLSQPSTESSCSAVDETKGDLPLVSGEQQRFHQGIGRHLIVDVNHGGLKLWILVQHSQPETPKWCLTDCLEVTSEDLSSPSCDEEKPRSRLFARGPHHCPTPSKRVDS